MLSSWQYSRPNRVVVGSQLFQKSVVTKPLGQVCGPNVSAFSNVLKFFLFFSSYISTMKTMYLIVLAVVIVSVTSRSIEQGE